MPLRPAAMHAAAIATREPLPRSVAAAIAELGLAEACLVLVEDNTAEIALFSIDRIVERYGHLAAIPSRCCSAEDIAAATRLSLVPSFRRRWPVSSLRGNGSMLTTPSVSPRRL